MHSLNMTKLFYSPVAPETSPSSLIAVSETCTSITINWTYSNPLEEVDGFVVYANNSLSKSVGKNVYSNGGMNHTTTLHGLLPFTVYKIHVRAYQDILGPASDETLCNTLLG